MFNNYQFREVIVRPTLDALQLYSLEAEELMVGICAQESLGGTYLKQLTGNAFGPFQMQKNDHDDLWNIILPNNIKLTHDLLKFCMLNAKPNAELMEFHLRYACSMARIHFIRFAEAIPKDVEDQAQYWKMYYNKPQGKGTVQEYLKNYQRFIGGRSNGQSERVGKKPSQGNPEKKEGQG